MKKGTRVMGAREYGMGTANRHFESTGEFREPKAGEYFISGEIPEAYKTLVDLSTSYWIAVRSGNPPQEITVNGCKYRLVE